MSSAIAYGTADFDLYARCGAYPTANQYDAVGYSGYAQEFLDITMSCGSTWYFAVNSYSGKGAFELKIGEGGDEEACVAFDDGGGVFTLAEKQTYRDKIVSGLKGFFAVTNGAILHKRLVFISGNTSSTCLNGSIPPASVPVDAVVRKDCTSSSTLLTGLTGIGPITYCTTNLDNSNSFPSVVPHEWSHHYWRLPDEYDPMNPSNAGCGHSLMGAVESGNIHYYSYCTAWNHQKDHDPFTYVDPGQMGGSVYPVGDGVSMWVKIGGDGMLVGNYFNRPINVQGPNPNQKRMRTSNTPDNYGFQDFNFNTYTTWVQVVSSF